MFSIDEPDNRGFIPISTLEPFKRDWTIKACVLLLSPRVSGDPRCC